MNKELEVSTFRLLSNTAYWDLRPLLQQTASSKGQIQRMKTFEMHLITQWHDLDK
jgi:hypothetical protein